MQGHRLGVAVELETFFRRLDSGAAFQCQKQSASGRRRFDYAWYDPSVSAAFLATSTQRSCAIRPDVPVHHCAVKLTVCPEVHLPPAKRPHSAIVRFPPLCQFVALLVGVLAGCGDSTTVYSLNGRARMHIVHETPNAIVEEGNLIGAFDAKIILDISLLNGAIVHFTLKGRSGSLEGTAPLHNYKISSPVAEFEDVGQVRSGTMAFAHIEPGPITFKTWDNRAAKLIINSVTGRVSAR